MSRHIRTYEKEMTFNFEDGINYLIDSFSSNVAHSNARHSTSKDRVCVYAFIGVSVCTCNKRLRLYCIKKTYKKNGPERRPSWSGKLVSSCTCPVRMCFTKLGVRTCVIVVQGIDELAHTCHEPTGSCSRGGAQDTATYVQARII